VRVIVDLTQWRAVSLACVAQDVSRTDPELAAAIEGVLKARRERALQPRRAR
jgi:hypothetical protein